MIVPILLYGCEVWGIYPIEMIEIFFRKFFKKLLRLRSSTPNCMTYGEVGKFPLRVTVDKYIISYWLRILNKKQSTLTFIVYQIMLNLHINNVYKAKWIRTIKSILDNCGLSYIWDNQEVVDIQQCKKIIHQQIEDQALQNWYTDITRSSMCSTYRILKKQFIFEKYLLLTNYRERTSLTRFRCANSKLPVYNQIYTYETDKCTLCDMNVLGDEYHYVLQCPYFRQSRIKYLKPYYVRMPKQITTNKTILTRLSKFVKIILQYF